MEVVARYKFEAMVADALDDLPDELLHVLDNVDPRSVRDLLGVGDATRCIQPCPGGCEAGLLEGGAEVGGAGTGGDGGHGAIVWADAPGRLNQGFRIW